MGKRIKSVKKGGGGESKFIEEYTPLLLCFMAENKSNKQYFERALSKSLTNLGHTTLKEQQN